MLKRPVLNAIFFTAKYCFLSYPPAHHMMKRYGSIKICLSWHADFVRRFASPIKLIMHECTYVPLFFISLDIVEFAKEN